MTPETTVDLEKAAKPLQVGAVKDLRFLALGVLAALDKSDRATTARELLDDVNDGDHMAWLAWLATRARLGTR